MQNEELANLRANVKMQIALGAPDVAATNWAKACEALLADYDSTLLKLEEARTYAASLKANELNAFEQLKACESRLDEASKELEYFQPAFEQTNEQLVKTARELDEAKSRLEAAEKALREIASGRIGGSFAVSWDMMRRANDALAATAVERRVTNHDFPDPPGAEQIQIIREGE